MSPDTPPDMRPERRTLAGAVDVLTGRAASMALQFLTLVVLGRTLGPASFGVVQFALTAFVFLGLAADLGSTIHGTRWIARGESAAPEVLTARAIQAAVVSALILVVVFAAPLELEHRVLIVVLTVGLLATTLSVRWYLQGLGRFREIAFADILAGLLQLGTAVLLVHGPGDLAKAAVVMIAGPLASNVIMRIQTRHSEELRFRMTSTSVATIRAAAAIGLAVIATQIYYSADTILLGLLRTPTDVGLYGAAYRIVMACLAIPIAAHGVALTIFSRATPAEDGAMDRLRRSITRWLLAVSLPIAVGTTLCAPMISVLVFGSAFAGAAAPLAILIWSCVTVSANAAFGAWMLAKSQDRRYLLVTLAACVANVAANLIAIPAFGIVGAAVVTLLTEVLVLMLIVWSVPVGASSVILAATRSAALPTLAMALAVVPFREAPLAIPVGAGVYVGASLLTGAISLASVRRTLAKRFDLH